MIVNLNNHLINTKFYTLRVMKLSVLFLFIGINLSFSAESYSQRTLLNISLKNVTVKEVFSTIERNSEYVFFYYNNAVDLNRRVNINAKALPIQKILDIVFAGTNNGYAINNRQISVFLKDRPHVGTNNKEPVKPNRKSLHIVGTVLDKSRNPLPGVSVRIVGEDVSKGTMTDINGHFNIDVSDHNSTLEFSYIGFKSIRTRIGKNSNINIQLEEDVLALNEVVVTGYGTFKKSAYAGSASFVKTESIKDVPNV